jgi:hypothetical protein
MSARKLGVWIYCGALAGLMTAGLFYFERHRAATAQEADALRIARQTAAQAEALAIDARLMGTGKKKERSEAELLSWAAGRLSQGQAGKAVTVHKATMRAEGGKDEVYQWDPATLTLDYARRIFIEKDEGVRVQVKQGYRGFLGARNAIEADVMAGLFFALAWGVLVMISFRAVPSARDAGNVQERVKLLVRSANEVAEEMSVRVREVVKGARDVLTTSVKAQAHVLTSREALDALSERWFEVGSALTRLHEGLEKTREKALSLVVEGSKDHQWKELAQDVHEELQKLVTGLDECMKATTRLEEAMTVVGHDMGEACERFSELGEMSGRFTETVRATSDTMKRQGATPVKPVA